MKSARQHLLVLLLPWLVVSLVRAAPEPVPLPVARAAACCESGDAGCPADADRAGDGLPADCLRCCVCLPFCAVPAESPAAIVPPVRSVVPATGDWTPAMFRDRPPVPPPKP